MRRRCAARAQNNSEQATTSGSDGAPNFAEAVRTSRTAEALEAQAQGPFRQQQLRRRAQPSTSPAPQTSDHAAAMLAISPTVDLAAASAVAATTRAPPTRFKIFMYGAAVAVTAHYMVNFIGTLPVVQNLIRRFIWQGREEAVPKDGADDATNGQEIPGGVEADEETVEWVNMCWRKAWRVYQRGLERWLADLLQPLFDQLMQDSNVPRFVQRLRIAEFTLDHEAPYFSNMRRRNSRKDSDLTGVVDVRYTGGVRMLLLIECGTGRWRIKVPVMVSELDLECSLWVKIRLAPMCPYIGTISLAFVGPPSIRVQLSPYNKLRLMKIPILQPFLSKLLTVNLPALMVLPKRLEINIPPAVTAVAEAAVGRDAVMRAVASAVLQADALEHALISALPLGPQSAAGGISLPDLFQGELEVVLKEARNLPVWGFPWQSNPYCRVLVGSQAVRSRRDSETSQPSSHRAPVWNQEFQFLVEDPSVQAIEIVVRDSPITGRTDVGRAKFMLSQLSRDSTVDVWLPVESSMPGERTQGAVHLSLTYRPFQDDEADSGYREAAAFAQSTGSQDDMDGADQITDVKSAADASSRAAVAASAAAAAVAVTKAAAARAAARLARAARGEDGNQGGGPGGPSQVPAPTNGSSAAEGTAPTVTAGNEKVVVGLPPLPPQKKSLSNADVPSSNGSSSDASFSAQKLPEFDISVLSKLPSATDPAAQEAAVEQLEAMAATMQQLTDEVQMLSSRSNRNGTGVDPGAAEAAAKAVAAAEALAVTAVVAGDVGAANRALQQAAAALEKTAVKLATAGKSGSSMDVEDGGDPQASLTQTQQQQQQQQQVISSSGEKSGISSTKRAQAVPPLEGQTPAERAAAALAAAQAAAAAAAAAVAAADAAASQIPISSEDFESFGEDDEIDVEAGLGTDAIPGAIAGEDSSSSSSGSDSEGPGLSSAWPQSAPWWNQAIQMVPGVPESHDWAADAVAEADGGAAMLLREGEEGEAVGDSISGEVLSSLIKAGKVPTVSGVDGRDEVSLDFMRESSSNDAGGAVGDNNRYSRGGPLGDIIISSDIPIEEIAAEVQKSWKLRDRHVETLLQKAVENRVRRSERPWLMATAVMATASAVLLSIVLYRLYTG